jgi:PST family polysaccharide transporter
MGSLTTVLGPAVQVVLRQLVLKEGIQPGANWQAAIRLSDIVFGTWAMAFSAWALPRLAARSKESKRDFLSMGGASAMAFVVLLAAPLILSLAYAHRFQDATGVFRLQALAEVSRAFGLPWTLRLMSRRAVRIFSFLELGATALQIGLAWLLIPRIGMLGAPLAVLLESAATAVVTRFLVLRLEASEAAAANGDPAPLS